MQGRAMKIVFLSNYYNHHQSALSERLNLLSRGRFAFIKTTEIGEERVALGWKTDEPDYVISYGAAPERCDRLISDADMVLYGAAPVELIKPRLAGNKPVFKYSERIFKNFKAKITLPLRIFKYRRDYGNRNRCRCAYSSTAAITETATTYILCAQAHMPPPITPPRLRSGEGRSGGAIFRAR